MLYFLTFGFFILYLAFLGTLVWLFVHRFLAPRIEAGRAEATVIFYMTMIVSLIFLILVNYHTGFLSEIYLFFDDALFDGQYTRRPPGGLR
ncbi:MAG: hypothetical protein P1S46_09540 [bacterium]|nr:hypothetical protein [bacterium]MDT8395140.1 hypothetical protein [bacterium]